MRRTTVSLWLILAVAAAGTRKDAGNKNRRQSHDMSPWVWSLGCPPNLRTLPFVSGGHRTAHALRSRGYHGSHPYMSSSVCLWRRALSATIALGNGYLPYSFLSITPSLHYFTFGDGVGSSVHELLTWALQRVLATVKFPLYWQKRAHWWILFLSLERDLTLCFAISSSSEYWNKTTKTLHVAHRWLYRRRTPHTSPPQPL